MINKYTFALFFLLTTAVFAQEVNLYRVNIEGNVTTSDKMIKYSAQGYILNGRRFAKGLVNFEAASTPLES